MKNKAIKFGIFAVILPHLFCCVLPIVLSLIGLFIPEISYLEFIPEWMEIGLFIFSAFMLGLSWLLLLNNHKNCKCKGEKSHMPQQITLLVITILFIVSIFLHLLSHY